MPEFVRLRRQVRLLVVVSLALGLIATWGWLRPTSRNAEAIAPSTPEEVDDLRTRLARANRAERLRLIHALGQTGGARALDGLIDALGRAHNDTVRRTIVAEIGRLGTEGAVAELERIAGGARPSLRRAAIAAIGSARPQLAVASLRRLLDQPELRSSRDDVVNALGATGCQAALETLCKIALDPKDTAQVAAVSALGVMGEPAAFETLQKLGRMKPDRVRQAAIAALGDLSTPLARDELLKLAKRGSVDSRSHALMALAGYPDGAVQALLLQQANDGNETIAEAAVRGLTGGDPGPSDEVLGRLLENRHPQVRSLAVMALTQTDSPGGRERLVDLLADPTLSTSAAWALASMSDPEADAALLSTLSSDVPMELRHAAVNALGHATLDDGATQALEQIARSGSTQLAVRALQVVAQKKGEAATELLLDRFENGNQQLRTAALRALASLDDPRARRMVRNAALSGHTTAQYLALDSAVREVHPNGQLTLRELMQSSNDAVRAQAAAALARQGDAGARKALFDGLRRGNYRALHELAQSTDPGTRAQLLSALSDESVPVGVKQNIVGTLAQTASVQQLAEVAEHSDPQLAATALRALGNKGDRESQRLLTAALSSTDPARQQAALAGLETVGTAAAIDAIGHALDNEQSFPHAAGILARTGGQQALAHLTRRFSSANAEQRAQIVSSLAAEPGKHARALLERALDDPSDQVVSAAARNLARTGDRRIAPRLLALMRSSQSTTVRQAIAQTLRAGGGPSYRQHQGLIDEVLAGDS